MLQPGLYEQVINEKIDKELSCVANARKDTEKIDEAEAAKILSQYLSEIVKQGLDYISDNGGDLSSQVNLANDIVSLIQRNTGEDTFKNMSITSQAEQLRVLLKENDPGLAIGKSAKDVVRPVTSIAQSSLFTGAAHEPQMFSELKKEIASADKVDMLVSFVRWSGLRLFIQELKDFTQNGGQLRVITTTYMGATDPKAIEELSKLPNTTIKVSYNTNITRLHAKAYIFHRDNEYTTAYVGSSNISNAALTSGLEWNTKVTKKDLPETISKISATFEFYWNDKEFEAYTPEQKEKLIFALKGERTPNSDNSRIYTLEVRPYTYQQEILDRLQAERNVRGHFRNLVVAATGTGKTVISALDYRRFRQQNPQSPCRLLFIAHREEILKQSLETHRAVLRDANFGELFVGHYRPENSDHLFMSIQTFNSQKFYENIDSDFYDYIVIDESHHTGSATSYKQLLNRFTPKILLGLTATPERMDGENILKYFDNRIAAEIRLPEAIDRKLLCPFQYFGVTDIADLRNLRWSRGGYDRNELTSLYTINSVVAEARADMIIRSIEKYVTDINDVKGLGFCVSIEHARFMNRYFNSHNIPAMSLTGKSSDEERECAKKRLVSGDVRFIFVVDIYNEGVDIPEVNTVLFLRPTESLTVFLQQLGRGLRLAEGKDCLTVLDFIGQANQKYKFEEKFSALLSHTEKGVASQIKDGFVAVPKGCYIQLEEIAARYILENINSTYGRASSFIGQIKTFIEDTGKEITLSNFLDYYHLDARVLYKFDSFSRLCTRAGVAPDFSEPLETIIAKSLIKFASIDSRHWIEFLLLTLPNLNTIDIESLSDYNKRMLQMFYVTVWNKPANDWKDSEVVINLQTLANCPVMLEELQELLKYRYEQIDFIDEPVNLGFDCPLELHCSYSRDQILVALDYMNLGAMRQGVKWLPDKKIDLFFVTLNKSDKEYSPTTMYNDYSINDELFHWQSQSTTAETSATGQRYIHHSSQGSKIILFVREYKKDSLTGGAANYTFLGLAQYVSHEGSRPMNITWHLNKRIPAKFLKKTNKLVVA